MNHPISRRSLIQSAIASAVAVPLLNNITGAADAPAVAATRSDPLHPLHGIKLGVATYTFRQKPLAPTIEGIKAVNLHYCSIKDFHLPLKSTPEQRKEVSDQFRAAGIIPLSCGNIAIRTEADARQAFEYARDASIPTIVCAPTHDILPTLDKLVKEFDLKIAIHNHGPEDKNFPSPTSVFNAVKDLDPRVGLCVDVGHSSRAGEDPAEAIRKYKGRVYDSHLKDLVNHDPKSKPCEVGRGILNIPDILRAYIETQMPGHVGFEYEINANEPLPGLIESVAYTRGILAALPA